MESAALSADRRRNDHAGLGSGRHARAVRLRAAGEDGRGGPSLTPGPTPCHLGTAYTYDTLGRTVEVLLADGASYTTYIYQCDLTTVVDPSCRQSGERRGELYL